MDKCDTDSCFFKLFDAMHDFIESECTTFSTWNKMSLPSRNSFTKLWMPLCEDYNVYIFIIKYNKLLQYNPLRQPLFA